MFQRNKQTLTKGKEKERRKNPPPKKKVFQKGVDVQNTKKIWNFSREGKEKRKNTE